MRDLLKVVWPGWQAIGEAARWSALAFAAAYVITLSWVGGTDVGTSVERHTLELLVLAALALGVVGTQRPIRGGFVARIRAAHAELPGARSPVLWVYVLPGAIGAAVLAVFLASGNDPPRALSAGLAGAAIGLAGVVVYASAAAFSSRVGRERVATPPPEVAQHAYFADHPIRSESDDVLDRGPIVTALVDAILDLHDAAPGFVSLEGDWGGGKSSVVGLAQTRLTAASYVAEEFSGFHFATTDRLVEALVATIERALNKRYATVEPGLQFRAFYKGLKPVLTGVLPFGLPDAPDGQRAAKARLEALLMPIRRPIVVFLEDLDRMRGEDLLTLLGAVQLLGSIRGFVFVLVVDRQRCAWQLRKLVPDPDEYLRKSIHAAITLPEAPPDVLGQQFSNMLDQVLGVRGTRLVPPERLAVQWEDWLGLAPTLRHLKQLVNAYSTTLALLGSEINAFDALVLTALDQADARILDLIDQNPTLWLESVPAKLSFQAALASRDRSKERDREDAIKGAAFAVAPDLLKVFLDAVFPLHRDSASGQAGQHVSEWEYFRRYRERTVNASFLRDEVVAGLIQATNTAGLADAQAVVAERLLGAEKRVPLLNKLVVRAGEFDPSVRLPVILACAAASRGLDDGRTAFEPNERDRARALIFSVLELERDDRARQEQWIDAAIRGSSSLEFARGLVVFSSPERNRILSSFDAFDEQRLKRVLADTIRDRLAGGYNPFEEESPRAAPPTVIAALEDPADAARWAIQLGGLTQVLESARPYGRGGTILDVINWDTLQEGYDWRVLAKGVPNDREPTELERQLLAGPPKRDDGGSRKQEQAGRNVRERGHDQLASHENRQVGEHAKERKRREQ